MRGVPDQVCFWEVVVRWRAVDVGMVRVGFVRDGCEEEADTNGRDDEDEEEMWLLLIGENGCPDLGLVNFVRMCCGRKAILRRA